jgi:hypothetical protein
MERKKMEKNNKPAYEQRLGNIRVTVWENVSDKGAAWHNVAITRRYKEDDAWKETATFNGLGDLAQVAAAVGLAQDWIKCRQDQRALQEDTAY